MKILNPFLVVSFKITNVKSQTFQNLFAGVQTNAYVYNVDDFGVYRNFSNNA